MKLEGTCLCGAVKFTVESHTPYPQEKCYCSICRKIAGSAGYAIHLLAKAKTLRVQGKDNIVEYRAMIKNPEIRKQGLATAKIAFVKFDEFLGLDSSRPLFGTPGHFPCLPRLQFSSLDLHQSSPDLAKPFLPKHSRF